jgi:hypothetical protein
VASKGLAALTPNANFYNGAAQSKISAQLAGVIDGLSKTFGGETIGIQSGYRSPAYNAKAGGTKGSLHMKGLAADIDMSGWSTAKRQEAVKALTAMGVGGFITYDKYPDMMHIDLRPQTLGVPHFMHNKYGVNMPKAPAWFREMAASFKPKTTIQAKMAQDMNVPSTMTRAQAMAEPLSPAAQKLANQLSVMGASKAQAEQMAREASIAAAYGSPSRAQDVVSAGRKPSASDLLGLTVGLDRPNPASRPGLNMPAGPTRPSVPASYPGRPASVASAVAGGFSAPVGAVTRAPLGPALSRPAAPPSNFAKGVSITPSAAPKSNRIGRMDYAVAPERFDRPTTRQAAGTPTAGYEAPRQAAGTPTAGYDTKAQAAGTPTAGYNPASPTEAELSAQHQSYRSPTQYAGVKNQIANDLAYAEYEANRAKAFSAMPAPGLLPPAPVAAVAPPTPPPALVAPPAAILAPVLAPPTTIRDYPVASIPAAPRPTAYDVYSGLAETAKDNTGLNTVGRLPDGTTTVTNQYGATTGMKNGYQTAVGSLPGISAPTASKFGQKVKGAVPTLGGAALGGILAGPAGALLGAALAKAVASPGGLLSKQNNFKTDWFGNIVTNKPQGGLGFPSAPSGGYGNKSASFSNRSAEGMRSISPGAAAAISAGKGGLY